MSERRVYADYNATTPLNNEVKKIMIESLEIFGNASSMHTSGRLAYSRIEEARNAVGVLIGAPSRNIIFTSGGSESNNTVFKTMRHIAKETDKNEIITTSIEHPCVLNAAKFLESLGFKVTFLKVDEYGKININELKSVLNNKTLFVSVMLANNEIGTIQNIKEITSLAKSFGAWVHTDAVQAVGKIPVSVAELGVDYLTISAHKIYGPKGVGALYVKKDAPFLPLIHGGHQEDGFRAGTYNTAGILGFGKAAEIAQNEIEKYGKELSALKTQLKEGLLERIPNIKINGHPTETLPNTLNISFPGAEGEAILLSLDIAGVEVSTGSACASGSLDPSHVLIAIGVSPELAHGSVRFSLGWGNTKEDIEYILEVTPPIIKRLRSMSTIK